MSKPKFIKIVSPELIEKNRRWVKHININLIEEVAMLNRDGSNEYSIATPSRRIMVSYGDYCRILKELEEELEVSEVVHYREGQPIPDNFGDVVKQYYDGKISQTEASEKVGMSKESFIRYAVERYGLRDNPSQREKYHNDWFLKKCLEPKEK